MIGCNVLRKIRGIEKSSLFHTARPIVGQYDVPKRSNEMSVIGRRMKEQRDPGLEFAMDRYYVAYKVLLILNFLWEQREQVAPIWELQQLKSKVGLSPESKMSEFIKKFPKLFEMCRDRNGKLWCGMTKEAEDLLNERIKIFENYSDKAAEHVTRVLMMSVNKRMSLADISTLQYLGLPRDYKTSFVPKYPNLFKVVTVNYEHRSEDFLELVSWNPDWAITELEKEMDGICNIKSRPFTPGRLSLHFPLKPCIHLSNKWENFQRQSYMSPYTDAEGRSFKCLDTEKRFKYLEKEKRSAAIIHELLSLSVEKRLFNKTLYMIRREFKIPKHITWLVLKYNKVFYVTERGHAFHVFLRSAYSGSELIDKCPLSIWKEKLLSLIIMNYDEMDI